MLFPRVRGARGAGGRSICDGVRGLVVRLADLRGLGGCGLLVLGRHGGCWRILRWGVQLLGPGSSGGWRVAGGCGLGVGLERVRVLEGEEVDVGSKHGHGVGLGGGERETEGQLRARKQFDFIQLIDLITAPGELKEALGTDCSCVYFTLMPRLKKNLRMLMSAEEEKVGG